MAWPGGNNEGANGKGIEVGEGECAGEREGERGTAGGAEGPSERAEGVESEAEVGEATVELGFEFVVNVDIAEPKIMEPMPVPDGTGLMEGLGAPVVGLTVSEVVNTKGAGACNGNNEGE